MGRKLCEICAKRSARYVCQECGRNVCELCLESSTWLCSECYEKVETVQRLEAEKKLPFHLSFVKIFLVGFFLIFLGMVLLIIAALTSGLFDSLSFFLLIGFIPIVFGVGEYPFWAIILGIILAILSTVFFILLRRTIKVKV